MRLPLALVIVAAGCVRACDTPPPTFASDPPATGPADAEGWVRVQQPGWFAVTFPGAPRPGEGAMKSSAGTFRIKTLTTFAPSGERYGVIYAEPSALPSDEAMFREAHASFEKGGGVTFVAERRFEVSGRAAFQLDLALAPDSRFNGFKGMAISQIRIIHDGQRYFELEYTSSFDQAVESHAARFFESFELKRGP